MRGKVREIIDAHLHANRLCKQGLCREAGLTRNYLSDALSKGFEHAVVIKLSHVVDFPPDILGWAEETIAAGKKRQGFTKSPIRPFHDVPLYSLPGSVFTRPWA